MQFRVSYVRSIGANVKWFCSGTIVWEEYILFVSTIGIELIRNCSRIATACSVSAVVLHVRCMKPKKILQRSENGVRLFQYRIRFQLQKQQKKLSTGYILGKDTFRELLQVVSMLLLLQHQPHNRKYNNPQQQQQHKYKLLVL